MRGDSVRRERAGDGSRYRRGRAVVVFVSSVGSCIMQPSFCTAATRDRGGLFRGYCFFARADLRRGALFVAPGPSRVSISSGRRDLVPFGTIAATTGFLSTLRSWRRGGFSLRYSSPHWRSAVSAMLRSRPFFVRWYSYRSGRSL